MLSPKAPILTDKNIWERTDIEFWNAPYEYGTKEYDMWSAIDHINSCFCYGQLYLMYDEENDRITEHYRNYWGNLNEKEVLDLYKKRVKFLKEHAQVKQSCFTDNEGCSYNSMSFA